MSKILATNLRGEESREKGIKGNIYILHLDDDLALLEMSKIYIERLSNNIIVDTVSTIEDFFGQFIIHQYDVIVSDFQLGAVLNGSEILEIIRNGDNNIPYIIVSGHESDELKEKVRKLNAELIFKKNGAKTLFEELVRRIYESVS